MKKEEKNNQPITKSEMKQVLGEFTEDALLPSIEKIFQKS